MAQSSKRLRRSKRPTDEFLLAFVKEEMLNKGHLGDSFPLIHKNFHKVISSALERHSCHPTEKEDQKQEVLIRVFRALPEFRGGCSIVTWIYQISVNVARSWRRKARNGPTMCSIPEDDTEEALWIEKTPETIGDAHSQLELALENIKKLPPKWREAVEASIQFEGELKPAAKLLGLDYRTYKTRLRRARKKIRKGVEYSNLPPMTAT